MKYRYIFISFFALFFFFAGVTLSNTAFAQFTQEAQRSTASDVFDAEMLRSEAKHLREMAARTQERAKGYRELQKNAEEYAKTTNDPENKAMWERDAKARGASAENYEQEAAADLKKAEAAEAEADRLEGKVKKTLEEAETKQADFDAEVERLRAERAAKKANERNENTCQFDRAQELIGIWQYEGQEEDEEPFAIVNEDPEMEHVYPNELELHNSQRVWKGTFITQKNLPKDEPRLTFKYKPEAKEINREDIPEWAREKVAGDLEWELEIWAECEDGATIAVAKFFPGEIHWDDDTKEASVEGRGEERKLYLIPKNQTMIESLAQSSIGIRLSGGADPFVHPVEGLTKRQRFFIDVRLPEDKAKEVGSTLTVNIKGLTGGDTDSIQLTAAAVRGGNRPVRYSHHEAITIADSTDWREQARQPQFMSIPWIFNATGARMNLDVENAEVVQFSYGDMTFEVPMYNSWVQIGNARFRQAADQVRAVLNSIISGPYPKAQKDAAHKRMRLMANYQMLLYSEHLNDLHRYKLGDVYLGASGGGGLAHMTEAELDSAYDDGRSFGNRPHVGDLEDPLNPMMKIYLEELSGKDLSIKSGKVKDEIIWVHQTEKQKVLAALRKQSVESRQELLESTYKNLSYGLYQGFTTATNTDSLYLVMTGKDIFGKPAAPWMRLITAVGAGSSLVLKVAGPAALNAFSKRRAGKRFGLSSSAKSTMRSTGAGAVNVVDDIVDAPGARSMSASKRRQTVVLAVDEPLEAVRGKKAGGTGGPTCFSAGKGGVTGFVDDFADEAAFERALRDVAQDPDPANSLNPRYLKEAYPEGLKVVEDYRSSFPVQSPNRATCNAKTFEWIMSKRTNFAFELGEDELHKMLDDIMFDETFSAVPDPKKQYYRGYGYNVGYANWMIRKLGRRFGLKVSEVAGKNASRVSLRSIRKYLQEGAGVKAVIKLDVPAQAGANGVTHSYHAVSIEDIAVDSRGYATRVRFFDSNVSAVLELPAIDFKRMLLKEDLGYGNITVFQ